MISCTSILKSYHAYSLAFIVGLISVFGFSPFNFYAVPFLTILFFLYLQQRSPSKYLSSIFFGLGFFLGGIHWIFISLNVFGQMPIFLAAFLTLLFCLFLSLFFLPLAFGKHHLWVILVPITFTLAEWLRGFIFTGFPWISYGYSQLPGSPLAGYFAITGVHGVTFLIFFSATLIFTIISSYRNKLKLLCLFGLILIWLGGYFLQQIEWTKPFKEPFSVSLLQGNIPQDKKWDKDLINQSLIKYINLIESSSSSLIILPETSIPLLYHNLPSGFKKRLSDHAHKNEGDIIIGVIEKQDGHYFNSALSIGRNGEQRYQKFHLVPFGEFIPFKFILKFIYENWLNIPFSDLSRGPNLQDPFLFNGIKLAINICYEDVFGYEITKPLPNANILVNLSNDAWYGESIASKQHLQIAQGRALETGRMMLRSTNTGATAIISAKGRILNQLPLFKEGILSDYVQPFEGSTPYIRYGNYPIVGLCVLLLIFCFVKRKNSGPKL